MTAKAYLDGVVIGFALGMAVTTLAFVAWHFTPEDQHCKIIAIQKVTK